MQDQEQESIFAIRGKFSTSSNTFHPQRSTADIAVQVLVGAYYENLYMYYPDSSCVHVHAIIGVVLQYMYILAVGTPIPAYGHACEPALTPAERPCTADNRSRVEIFWEFGMDFFRVQQRKTRQ